MVARHRILWVLLGCLSVQSAVVGQNDRHPGSAVVRVDSDEYTIRIECDDASRPELGFTTEPNRLTREATGRTNMVNLRLRPWKDTGDVIITLDRYVAWIPQPASAGGVLSVETGMSSVSTTRNNQPTLTTYDMWNSGDRPDGLETMMFEARCGAPDPDAPAFRKLDGQP